MKAGDIIAWRDRSSVLRDGPYIFLGWTPLGSGHRWATDDGTMFVLELGKCSVSEMWINWHDVDKFFEVIK